MNKNTIFQLILGASLFLSLHPPIQESAKIKAMNDYMDEFLSSQVNDSKWNGSNKDCKPGFLSDTILCKAERRINYFRRLVGIGKIELIDSLNNKAQNTALVAFANNNVKEIPDRSWKCYKKDIENISSLSNIGYLELDNQKNILTSFMEEDTEANIYCPHRRLFLFSGATEYGYGATEKTEVLFFSKYASMTSKVIPEFVAYPSKGFNPAPLVFKKWSFSIPGAKNVNFAYTNVIMKDDKGGVIKTDKYNSKQKIFDPTFVWDATGMFSVDEIVKQGKKTLKDRGYTEQWISVEINKVIIDGRMQDFFYQVYIIDI